MADPRIAPRRPRPPVFPKPPLVALVLQLLVALILVTSSHPEASAAAATANGSVGVLYRPEHNFEFPVLGGFPDRAKLRAAIQLDLELLSKYVTHIRTLAATYYGIDIVPMARDVGLKVFVGIPISVTRVEVRRQTRAAQQAVMMYPETIATIMLGNAENDMNLDDMLGRLAELKTAMGPYATKVKFGIVPQACPW